MLSGYQHSVITWHKSVFIMPVTGNLLVWTVTLHAYDGLETQVPFNTTGKWHTVRMLIHTVIWTKSLTPSNECFLVFFTNPLRSVFWSCISAQTLPYHFPLKVTDDRMTYWMSELNMCYYTHLHPQLILAVLWPRQIDLHRYIQVCAFTSAFLQLQKTTMV